MKIGFTAHALFTQQTDLEMRHYLAFSVWTRLPEPNQNFLLVAYYMWVEGAKLGVDPRPLLSSKGQNVTISLVASGVDWDQAWYLEGNKVDDIFGKESKASLTYIQHKENHHITVVLGGGFGHLRLTMRQYAKATQDSSFTVQGIANLFIGQRDVADRSGVTNDRPAYAVDGDPIYPPNDPSFFAWTVAAARWPGPHPFGE